MLIDILITTAERGGVEKIIKMMIEDLEGLDMHFRVVQLVWEGKKWLPDNVPYYPLLKGKGDYSLETLAEAYYRFLEENCLPDIVLASVWPYTVYVAKASFAKLAYRSHDARVISWMHHEITEYERYFNGVKDWLALADGHFAINNTNYLTLRELFPSVVTYRLRNPIEFLACNKTEPRIHNENYIKNNTLKLVFIGRISEEKNLELLLNTISRVKECELTIIGSAEDKGYERSLHQLAVKLGITDRVTWMGWQPDPWSCFSYADALCLTSLYEGFPLTILESLAHGIPVIASRTTGAGEIIEDCVTGYTFEVGDESAFEEILNNIIRSGQVGIKAEDCRNAARLYERHSVFWDMKIKLMAFATGEELKTVSDSIPWFAGEQLTKDKISVIIPCHNAEKYINCCLDSVLDQNLNVADWEIICVDEASTDNTLDILKEYESMNEERIMLISLNENIKQGGVCNIGLSYATGEYIVFVDSDDIIAPGMLDVLYRTMIKFDARIVGCDHFRFGGKVNPEFTVSDNEKVEIYDFSDPQTQKRYFIEQGWKTGIWARLYERRFLDEKKISFPEIKYMEDIYFSKLVMSTADKYVYINAPLYGYRIHNESI